MSQPPRRKHAPQRVVTLGRIVHFVAEEYEAPAMIVCTPEFVHNPEDDLSPEAGTVHLHVFHPVDIEIPRPGHQVPDLGAFISLEEDVRHSARGSRSTYHWADECQLQET